MTTIIIILAIWGIYRLLKGTAERRQAERAERESQRIREEQAAQRREIAEMRERAKAETRRQIEAEKARLAWQKRQCEMNRQAQAEREAMKKEQARQAAQLAKHDEMIANLTFRIQNAEHDILHIQKQMDEYMPLLWRLDDEMQELDRQISIAQQMGKVDAVNRYQKEKDKVQRKIISLENNIHAAEKKLAKAQFIKAQATAKLSA